MFTGNSHLVEGNAETVSALLSLLEKEGISTIGNPDVYVRTHSSFGADEARELRDRAGTRAITDTRRVFIIATPTMTSEAQNALLKTFEEPPGDALFFIIVPSPNMLLPTLRSRMQRLEVTDVPGQTVIDVKKFIAANPEKRIDMLKPLLEKGDDDKRDIGALISFLSALEWEIGSRSKEGLRAAWREGLESVYLARKYIADKGALAKPLLEQVALLLPRT